MGVVRCDEYSEYEKVIDDYKKGNDGKYEKGMGGGKMIIGLGGCLNLFPPCLHTIGLALPRHTILSSQFSQKYKYKNKYKYEYK